MNGSNNDPQTAIRERERYVMAFNDTMVKIWREQLTLLDAIDTGALYRSVVGTKVRHDGRFISITLGQSFKTYGLYVDYGTGRDTPRGNSGDLGHANGRRRKPWFSRKYYASVKNIQEFYAQSLGREFCRAIAHALSPSAMRRQINGGG